MFLFIIFLVLVALGIPIAIALGFVPFGYFLVTAKYPMSVLAYKMYDAIDNFTLIAIPLFILGGNLVTSIGLTEKLVNLCNELVGRIRGGLSHCFVLASTIFGGMNGSAVADTAAMGSLLIKPMIKMGFSRGYAAALAASAGTISALIPPSIPFILFATAVPSMSIGALFIGGILPGILVCIFMIIAGYLISRHRKYPKITTPFTIGRLLKVTVSALPALVLVVIILLGLRSGFFTPTEVAGVVVVYSLVFGFFFYRNLNLKILVENLYEAAMTTGIVFLVLACAGPFMWLLTVMGVAEQFTNALMGMTTIPLIWWFVVVVILLVAGMVMDTNANLLIIAPIVYQSAVGLGFDSFCSALAICITLLVGVVTPPVGISLFVAASVAETSIEECSLEIIPFVLCEVILVPSILFFPDAFKYLPRLFGYEV